jgi:hypothetical protein
MWWTFISFSSPDLSPLCSKKKKRKTQKHEEEAHDEPKVALEQPIAEGTDDPILNDPMFKHMTKAEIRYELERRKRVSGFLIYFPLFL